MFQKIRGGGSFITSFSITRKSWTRLPLSKILCYFTWPWFSMYPFSKFLPICTWSTQQTVLLCSNKKGIWISWLAMVTFVSTVLKNSEPTGIMNRTLRSRAKKLKQWEENLVAGTEHPIFPSWFRLEKIKYHGLYFWYFDIDF